MRQKTDGLTKKQKEVLEFSKQFHAENKYPPSIRQICSAINLSSPATVHVHINHLADKGYITLTEAGRQRAESVLERHTILSELLISIGVNNMAYISFRF